MPIQTTFSLQRASENDVALAVNNELYDYLGFGKTSLFVTMITRGAFQKLMPLLDSSWEKGNLAHLQVTLDADMFLSGQATMKSTTLANTKVLNFSFMSDDIYKHVAAALDEGTDYRQIGINSQKVVTVAFPALDKLIAIKEFSHLKAFVLTAPLPTNVKTLVNFMVITDPSIIVDIMNLSDVEQSIEIKLGGGKSNTSPDLSIAEAQLQQIL